MTKFTDATLDDFDALAAAAEARRLERNIREQTQSYRAARAPRPEPTVEQMLCGEYSLSKIRKARQELQRAMTYATEANYDKVHGYYLRDALWLIEQLLVERERRHG